VRRAAVACWNHAQVTVSPVWRPASKPLSVPAAVLRQDAAKDAEPPVLRPENEILREQMV
jgi:hypothetical protein